MSSQPECEQCGVYILSGYALCSKCAKENEDAFVAATARAEAAEAQAAIAAATLQANIAQLNATAEALLNERKARAAAEAKIEDAEDQLQWSASWLVNVPSINFGNDVADGVQQLLELYRAAEADAERLAGALEWAIHTVMPPTSGGLRDYLTDDAKEILRQNWEGWQEAYKAVRAALAAHDALKGGE
jgi:hypothetical protein